MDLSGKFLVIDGPDGCGKTTQIARLREWIEVAGGRCTLAKDPGGTTIGERIRHVLLGHDLSDMDARCEALLFMASRAQLCAEVIRPALAGGQTVLCDRFISSTCAYQVAAGVSREYVIDLGRLAVGDTWPDLTIVLDLPPEVGFERTGRTPQAVAAHKRSRNKENDQLRIFADADPHDAMERRSLEYHRKVREIFRTLPEFYPRPVRIVDATRPPETVFPDVLEALRDAFQ